MVTDKNGKRIKRRSGAKRMVMQPEFRSRQERNRKAYHRPAVKRDLQGAY